MIALDQVANPHVSDSPPPPTEEVQPTPTETVETAPETVEKAPETVQKPPSRSELTTQLTTATTELERVKSEVGVHEQKYKDALAKQEELQQQVKERDELFVKERTPTYRWQDDPDVAKPRAKAAAIFTDTLAELSPENEGVVRKDVFTLIDEYGSARSTSAATLRTFREKLTETFGEDGPKVFDMVKRMYPEHAEALDAEQRNSITHFDRTRGNHEKSRREVTERFVQIGRATPEQIKANPDDINSIISAAVGGDEDLLKEIDIMARKAADATVGLPPLPPDVKPEIVAQYRDTERRRAQYMKSVFEKDVQLRVLTSIVKKLGTENETLKKRVTTASEANRPDIATEATKKEVKKAPEGKFDEISNPYT